MQINILRINYKKEGDGFQCDALESNGYTYTFFLRNQPASQTYLDKDLCLLHARVMALLDLDATSSRRYLQSKTQ